jgi:hypothetical protein
VTGTGVGVAGIGVGVRRGGGGVVHPSIGQRGGGNAYATPPPSNRFKIAPNPLLISGIGRLATYTGALLYESVIPGAANTIAAGHTFGASRGVGEGDGV